jgi:hypothetical protein
MKEYRTRVTAYLSVPDWSDVQLNKYRAEIRSYLGNFLLRATSSAIMAPIQKIETRTLENIYKDASTSDPNREVILQMAKLAPKVKSSLLELEVAEALDSIVSLLRLVCPNIHTSFDHAFT